MIQVDTLPSNEVAQGESSQGGNRAAAAPAAVGGQTAAESAAVPAPEGILIVDDNAINRRILAAILRKHGYRLFEADGGIDGEEIARRERPDLILLDVMMAGRDGYQVCTALKADPRTAEIPVIFLSALSETADKVHGLRVGAVDFVTKPFDQAEVLARVQTHLQIRRLNREIVSANLALVERQRCLDEDLRAAAGIQRSLMPRNPDLPHNIALAWRFGPSEQIGGDLFNVHRLDDRYWSLYIIDVSGHGVPAAMVTVAVSQSLAPEGGITRQANAPGGWVAPARVLQELDKEYPIERFDKYFTIWYGVFDSHTGRLRYSQAGHPVPLLLHSGGTLERLTAGVPLIGFGMPYSSEEGEVQLQAGDRLYLYTDGIVEFENPDCLQFGEDRLEAELLRSRGVSLDESCDQVLHALRSFGRGTSFQDDVSLVAFEYRA